MDAPRVVFESADVVVVDKPVGWASQPGEGSAPDVLSWVARTHAAATLPHRLDLPTSGLLVVACSRRAAAPLAAAFRDRTARRAYLAVLAGEAPSGAWRWDSPVEGREARTDVALLGASAGMVAARLVLHTGRTHQIRRHAAAAGMPVVGDRRYGGPVGRWWPRLALHAARLELPPLGPLELPAGPLVAPLPADLSGLWATAGGPQEPLAAWP
jgi:23S rRNA-/tRNA-specific pseudouridylate synthase